MAHPAHVIDPFTASGSGEAGPFPFDLFERRILAQGDSWFSIGAVPPTLTSNVLAELELSRPTVVVNCARPGKALRHMTDTTGEAMFLRLLAGPQSMKWDAIVVSGGGNDVIDAATVGPDAPPQLRLLRTPAERAGAALQADDHLSAHGWTMFADHLGAVFERLVARRDGGQNRGVPLLFHTYSHVMPRPAPAGPGFGPWLQPALQAFAVPPTDWLAVSNALTDRLRSLIEAIVAARQAFDPACQLHVVDTHQALLQLADPTATGRSGDFVNEIHPTRGGFRKLAAVWQRSLDALA